MIYIRVDSKKIPKVPFQNLEIMEIKLYLETSYFERYFSFP